MKKRSQIEEKYKWNLNDIYATKEDLLRVCIIMLALLVICVMSLSMMVIRQRIDRAVKMGED